MYIVSGEGGLTNHTMVNALLVQYPNNNITLEIIPDVQSIEKVKEIVKQAKASNALITHTLVFSDIREGLILECAIHDVEQIDFMGPLASFIESKIGLKSISETGLFRKQNSQYFQRIDAIEFTLNHDDGLNPERLNQADIILTGV